MNIFAVLHNMHENEQDLQTSQGYVFVLHNISRPDSANLLVNYFTITNTTKGRTFTSYGIDNKKIH